MHTTHRANVDSNETSPDNSSTNSTLTLTGPLILDSGGDNSNNGASDASNDNIDVNNCTAPGRQRNMDETTPDNPESGDDYANHPPPVPLPSSPSYTHYLQALRATKMSIPLDISDPVLEEHEPLSLPGTDHSSNSIFREPSVSEQRRLLPGARTRHGFSGLDGQPVTVNDLLSENSMPRIRRNYSEGTFTSHEDTSTDHNDLNHPLQTTRSSSSLWSLGHSFGHGSGRLIRRTSGTTRNHRRKSSSGSLTSLDDNSKSKSKAKDETNSMKALKAMVFTFLNPRQHLALAICRDMPLWSCLYYMFQYFYEAYRLQYGHLKMGIGHHRLTEIISNEDNRQQYNDIVLANLLNTRSSEYLMAGMWCFVSSFMVYSILDGLIVRWIVVYTIPAAIVRMLSMSVLLITIIRVTLLVCNPNDSYLLHTWIFISCILTFSYIIQNFFVHDLDDKIKTNGTSPEFVGPDSIPVSENIGLDTDDQTLEPQPDNTSYVSFWSNILNGHLRLTGRRGFSRYFNYYNIVIYAVMPIGVASFITMIVLLRNILILKLDIETIYRNEWTFPSGEFYN